MDRPDDGGTILYDEAKRPGYDPGTIFGNPIPPGKVRAAERTFRKFARRFAFDPTQAPSLKPEPMPLAFEELGIYQLVEDRRPDGAPRRPDRWCGVDPDTGVVIGTIRMGFGHYRIGLAIASAARSLGQIPYWHDLLAFPDTTASQVIAHLERLYVYFSRMSQRYPLFNRMVWEKVTSDFAQRLPYVARDRELSRLYAPLCADLQPAVPFVSTHPWAALAAVRAGIEQVVTVVPDNYPLAFHLVEGSIHAVQTPSAYLGYRSLRNMGTRRDVPVHPIPEREIRYTGHFVDHELVSNIESDCDRRFRRITDHLAKRILLSIGGAGAQVRRFFAITRWAAPLVSAGKVALFINMGDHVGRWLDLRAMIEAARIPYTLHTDWHESRAFAAEAIDGPGVGIHVFLHRDIFAAVYVTNLLMRAADVLVTKPSELSFYPVPKLFIQRVGRHEAWGAIRGAEIGDGTLETSSIGTMLQTLGMIVDDHDLLRLYTTSIVNNKAAGIYDGAYNVVKLAMERRREARGRAPGFTLA